MKKRSAASNDVEIDAFARESEIFKSNRFMKHRIFSKTFGAAAIIAVLALCGTPAVAGDSSSGFATVTSGQKAPALSYGAANVLKLAQAGVAEETIVAYVEKSGQGYGSLGADEMIYLRERGVSDRVLTTMLNQEKISRDTIVAQTAAQPATVAPAQAVAPVAPVVAVPQYQQTYVPPAVTYVETAPAPLIVMRDSSPRLVDYGIYPRRYSYGCFPSYGYRSYYSHPRFSFSVGFGHHGGFGFHNGGFHGRYCR